MNDVDRWVNLGGPEPEGVRKLLDGAVAPPDLTPEQEEARDRRLFAALAEKRAQRARRRTMKRVVTATTAALALAAGIALVLHFARPDSNAMRPKLNDVARAPETPTITGTAPAPSPSVTAVRRPERRRGSPEPPAPR